MKHIIKMGLDTSKVNPKWFTKFEKQDGSIVTELNITLQIETDDEGNIVEQKFGKCGMVTQDVPKAIWEKDKSLKGIILGNGKAFDVQPKEADEADEEEWNKKISRESKEPAKNTGKGAKKKQQEEEPEEESGEDEEYLF